MIKITKEYLEEVYCELLFITKYSECICINNECRISVLNTKDIIKVEKQVKDLTFEEMIKLGAMQVEVNDYEGKYGIDLIAYVLRDKNWKDYGKNDYIDITALVKGE